MVGLLLLPPLRPEEDMSFARPGIDAYVAKSRCSMTTSCPAAVDDVLPPPPSESHSRLVGGQSATVPPLQLVFFLIVETISPPFAMFKMAMVLLLL